MAGFTVVIVPFQLSETEALTNAKANQLGNPTVSVTGGTTALSDFSPTAPTEGQTLFYRMATGQWTPEALPAANSDAANRMFMWEHFQ